MKKKKNLSLPELLRAAEREHTKLLDKFSRLQTDNHKARAKYQLLSACLELLRWLHEQQQEDACSHAVPVDELLEQQLLQLALQPSSDMDAGSPQQSEPDAWRTCPMAPRHDPLALLREVFQLPPHPGAGPGTTLQRVRDCYAAICRDLALHMRLQANSHASAEAAAASAAKTRAAMVDWYSLVVALLSSPQAGLLAQLLATNCATGETVAFDLHGDLHQAVLQRIVLSLEQQERIAVAYEVLSQLHSASLEEAMALRCSLGEPAAELFGTAALPVGLLQPAEDAVHPHDAGSNVVRERHQADLQQLRVKFNKSVFWEHCLCCSFAGALTVNQLCELALAMFPFHLRFSMLARRVTAMHQESQEQQEQQAKGRKGRQRQQTRHQHDNSGSDMARHGSGIAACGSAG